MDKIFEFIINKLEGTWHKFYSAILVSLLSVLIIVAMFNSSPVWCLLTLCLGSTGIIIFTWIATHRLPKVKKGKIGIAVSLVYEHEEEAKQLESDFISILRNLLQRDPDGANIGMIVLPDYISSQMQDYSNFDRILRKCRAHMLLYGTVKRRTIQGKEMHVLNIEGFIRHAPIPVDISRRFAEDFATSIPRKLMLPTEDDVLIFESASTWFDLSARYIIGVAAYLSGSVGYAERMFLNVENALKGLKSAPPFLQSIAKKLPFRFIELYRHWQAAVHNAYNMTENIALLKFEDSLNDKLLARDPSNYAACLGKSISEFILNRNISKAKEYLLRTSDSKDATWLYNLAFLFCYEGDLHNAHENYRKAFRKITENVTVPIQCEEFIQRILAKEPDKDQLYFSLGLINYNAKKDFYSAKKDFSRFLNTKWSKQYTAEKTLCEKLKKRCEERTIKGSEETPPDKTK